MNDANQYDRYQRQIILKELGGRGQQLLQQAKVLVVGAGGLGCPALQYLAAAGVGNIGIADDDMVSISNLHRQILYTANDIGLYKASVAVIKLHEQNPAVNFTRHLVRLSNSNALEIIAVYDIIIDGSDNFETRYMLNDACVLLNKPLVYGSIFRFDGQLAVFNVNGSCNYRDIFPVAPAADEIPNCNDAGVLGVLPGIIGTLQALEAIKLIAKIGTPLINRLLGFSALSNRFFETIITPLEETNLLIPADTDSFLLKDYNLVCAIDTAVTEIDNEMFDIFINNKNTIVIDVRNDDELPVITQFKVVKIPLHLLAGRVNEFSNQSIVTICQSGNRSLQAAKLLAGNNNKVYSLQGGLEGRKPGIHVL